MHFSRPGACRRVCALASALVLAVPTWAMAQARHNPGYDRPGLGFTPAVLDTGGFTLEQGFPDFSRSDGVSAYSADTLLRLGVGHALELQLGTGADWLAGGVHAPLGRADTSLALKFAPAVQGDFSWGLLGSVEFTDGALAFRNARRQYLVGASFNWQASTSCAFGLYAEWDHGDSNGGLLAANASWALPHDIGAYVELAEQYVAQTGYGSLAGAGLTWQATPRIQLDASLRRRLGGDADAWQGGVGFSVYFGD